LTTDGESTALTTAGRAFLTARWQHLCLLNYAVEPERLASRLPAGLELDTRGGEAFMSLVAFDFLDTRVLGVPWPFYRNFPEINLRFYVRHGDRRGVMFIREYVPKRMIAWVARWLYNEPYRFASMRSTVESSAAQIEVFHGLRLGGREHTVRVTAEAGIERPAQDSEAHFFKEHSWGFGASRGGKLLQYEVRHPVWETHAVTDVQLDWDWGAVYGPEWADYNAVAPRSTFLAVGSNIAVAPKRLLD
jgi:uncharacterized protein YqjF (DUF2071 family)